MGGAVAIFINILVAKQVIKFEDLNMVKNTLNGLLIAAFIIAAIHYVISAT